MADKYNSSNAVECCGHWNAWEQTTDFYHHKQEFHLIDENDRRRMAMSHYVTPTNLLTNTQSQQLH
jgi:hypothetical protein